MIKVKKSSNLKCNGASLENSIIKRFKPDYNYRSAHGPLVVRSWSAYRPLMVRFRLRSAHSTHAVHLWSAHGPPMARPWSAYCAPMVRSWYDLVPLTICSCSAHGPLTIRTWSTHGPLTVCSCRLRSAHGLVLVRSLSLTVKQNIISLYLNTALGNRTFPWLWSLLWTLLLKHGEEYLTGCWLNRDRPYSCKWGFRVTHFLHQTLTTVVDSRDWLWPWQW